MEKYKTLFTYPDQFEDVEIYQKTVNSFGKDIVYYGISIEGLIYYDNIQEGLSYLISLKNKYYEWLIKNYNINELVKEYCDLKSNYVYRSYDIEIIKDEYDSNKIFYLFFLHAPSFSTLYETYEWLEGVIKQIKTINI